jgi:hypothetical protein
MILQHQYAMLQYSRELLFRFIETTLGQELHRSLSTYDNKSVRDLPEHNADAHSHTKIDSHVANSPLKCRMRPAFKSNLLAIFAVSKLTDKKI